MSIYVGVRALEKDTNYLIGRQIAFTASSSGTWLDEF